MNPKPAPRKERASFIQNRRKNTKLEMIVRRGLWKRGFRYRQTKKNCCCAQFAGFVQQEGK